MTVWVLEGVEYEEYGHPSWVVGIFSSAEAAKNAGARDFTLTGSWEQKHGSWQVSARSGNNVRLNVSEWEIEE